MVDKLPITSPDAHQEDVVDIEQQSSPENKRRGLSKTVHDYVEGKTSNPVLQKEMEERVIGVGLKGAKEVRADIAGMFPNQEILQDNETLSYSEALKQEQLVILEGQQEKVERMEQYVDDMNDWASSLIEEFTLEISQRNDIDDEQKEKLIAEYANNTQQLVVESARVITYQDTRASAVSLGDHGWMHLTQDLRDARFIAEGKLAVNGGDKVNLSAKENFMLGLAAANHDVGYAVPGVSDEQRNSQGNYGSFDKGHPVNSFVYMISDRQKFVSVLGNKATESLMQMVANHENPERADFAGDYSHLSEAFAQADASAAFGKDKLPPIIVQIPEVLSYVNALTIHKNIDDPEIQALFQTEVVDELRQRAFDRIDEKIKHKGSEDDEQNNMLSQSEALKNSVDHFSPISLKFLLGRMSAESQQVEVGEDGLVDFTINAGFAHELELFEVIENTVSSASKLTVKLFLEQAAIVIDEDGPEGDLLDKMMDAISKNELPIDEDLQRLASINISMDSKGEPDPSVTLLSPTVRVTSNRHVGISPESREYYDQVFEQLDYANDLKAKFNDDHGTNIR